MFISLSKRRALHYTLNILIFSLIIGGCSYLSQPSIPWYTNLYLQGYVPPNATRWLNPDNNRNLINRKVVMTANTTLSIPAAVRQNADLYQNKLGTLEFPKKPNGEPMRYLVAVNAAILFANSNNQKEAKDFLAYWAQPETIKTYIKSAGGRYLPVMTPLWQDSFWTNPADPHFSTASKVLMKGQTRPFFLSKTQPIV